MRREWIEIFGAMIRHRHTCRSPSMRREWIEMFRKIRFFSQFLRLPPCGGSGLKYFRIDRAQPPRGLPPCGGSGLKSTGRVQRAVVAGESPSMRREWIEIADPVAPVFDIPGLPPCGGSGLKCRSCLHLSCCSSLPPCGGSGLKYFLFRLMKPYQISLPPCGGSGLK